jgi:hypothetical protein
VVFGLKTGELVAPLPTGDLQPFRCEGVKLRLSGQSGSRDPESNLSLGEETQKLLALELRSFSAFPPAREVLEEKQALNIFESLLACKLRVSG